MHTRSKLLVAALTAALLLALGASTASASRSFSVVGGGRAILAIANGERGSTRLTFAGESGRLVISDVTLHGSLHSLIAKTRGALAGVINAIRTANCRTEGAFGVTCHASGLPNFHIRLESFTGTLPRISTITLTIEAAFQILFAPDEEGGHPECLYRGNISATGGRNSGESVVIETLRVNNPNSATLSRAAREEFFRNCDRRGELIGTFAVTPTVSLRLH